MSVLIANDAIRSLIQEKLVDQVLKDHATSKLAAFRAEFNPVSAQFSEKKVQFARGERNAPGSEVALTAAINVNNATRREGWTVESKRLADAWTVHENAANFITGEGWVEQFGSMMESVGNTMGGTARSIMFNAAYAGHAFALTTGSVTVITLDTVNGFDKNIASGKYVASDVSATNPLDVYFYTAPSTWTKRTVTACDTTAKTITVSSAITLSGGKVPVVAANASRVEFADATNVSTDDVAVGDKLTWEAVMRAKVNLQKAGIKPHMDGNYHLYLSEKQFADILQNNSVFAAFNMPNAALQAVNPYINDRVFAFGGVMFVTADTLQYGSDSNLLFGAVCPLINETDVPLDYAIMTGRDGFEEGRIYATDPVSGSLVYDGVKVEGNFDGVKMVVRDAGDAVGELVSFGWVWLGHQVARTNYLSPKTVRAIDGQVGKAAYSHSALIVTAAY